ncbi:hypothetical protein I3843_08G067300 [Carya illinoinensis]|uniref:Uncharacterized protein n=1 Tax=Carya illinoinensis TaxID=32201 RepID=A0A922JAC4_CARIL|nr:hypothetical protein I3842_08G068900 [Carya illinoinensis]KAG7966817.1 hypothetical protein I3843_08G067300 [Carya illinoinensis]
MVSSSSQGWVRLHGVVFYSSWSSAPRSSSLKCRLCWHFCGSLGSLCGSSETQRVLSMEAVLLRTC